MHLQHVFECHLKIFPSNNTNRKLGGSSINFEMCHKLQYFVCTNRTLLSISIKIPQTVPNEIQSLGFIEIITSNSNFPHPTSKFHFVFITIVGKMLVLTAMLTFKIEIEIEY